MSAVSVEDGKGKSVNIDLNLVPFIDLMSCLVAFLLVTAAWTNVAQISMKPKGVGKDVTQSTEENKEVRMSVLIASDSHWVGLTTGDRRQIKKKSDEEYDWGELDKTLDEFKNAGVLKQQTEEGKNGPETFYALELAAEDGVKYQDIIWSMDSAIGKSFKDIGFVDPNSLSVRFKQ